MEDPTAWMMGKGLTTPCHKIILLQNITQVLKIALILCNDQGKGKWMGYLEYEMLGVYKAGYL
jgi:hypothetical protein